MNKLFLFMISLIAISFALPDSTNKLFFDDLEQRMRGDYVSCTGDTTKVSIKKITAWKHIIDSLLALPNYPAIAEDYRKKTGLSPQDVGPCAVAMWRLERDSVIVTIDKKVTKELHTEAVRKKDSIDLKKTVQEARRWPCLVGDIPFGVSRKVFDTLATHAGFDGLVDKKTYVRCNNVPVRERHFLGAFHFDTSDHYCGYELESMAFPVDSLDSAVWKDAEFFGTFFELKTGSSPLRTNRIGRKEITQGKLALFKVWSKPEWSVSVGLAEHKYRYYAKVVVTDKPLPTE